MLHVENILLEKFLFWLEVLSAVGMVRSASSSILRVLTAETTVSFTGVSILIAEKIHLIRDDA
jgi:hypothetical protein